MSLHAERCRFTAVSWDFTEIEFANLVGYRPIEVDLYRKAQPGPNQVPSAGPIRAHM